MCENKDDDDEKQTKWCLVPKILF